MMQLALQLASKPRRKHRKPMPANAIRVYFQDEAPRIGAGWRVIEPLTVGHKWAKFRDVATNTSARLPRATWLTITKNARTLP